MGRCLIVLALWAAAEAEFGRMVLAGLGDRADGRWLESRHDVHVAMAGLALW